MKFACCILQLLFTVSILNAQTLPITIVCGLPSVLNESSGIEISSPNKIWSHNDSGGQHKLYGFDSTGVLLKTITISNATNTDWEELAQDDLGNVYIGDFGNNNNDRTDLKIYKISNPNNITGTSTTAQIISFAYPDQNLFPPAAPSQNFDMESMFFYNDSLYLISKNRTNPYSGIAKLYQLPSTAGNYVANLLDSFYTGNGNYVYWSATSADISPDKKNVVVLSGDKIWLFSNFTSHNFFQGNKQMLYLSNSSQKEGVCFVNNTSLYFTDEVTVTGTGNLYKASIADYVTRNELIEDNPIGFNAWYNDQNGFVEGNYFSETLKPFQVNLISITGELAYSKAIQIMSNFYIDVNLLKLKSGLYFLQIVDADKTLLKKIMLVNINE